MKLAFAGLFWKGFEAQAFPSWIAQTYEQKEELVPYSFGKKLPFLIMDSNAKLLSFGQCSQQLTGALCWSLEEAEAWPKQIYLHFIFDL